MHFLDALIAGVTFTALGLLVMIIYQREAKKHPFGDN